MSDTIEPMQHVTDIADELDAAANRLEEICRISAMPEKLQKQVQNIHLYRKGAEAIRVLNDAYIQNELMWINRVKAIVEANMKASQAVDALVEDIKKLEEVLHSPKLEDGDQQGPVQTDTSGEVLRERAEDSVP